MAFRSLQALEKAARTAVVRVLNQAGKPEDRIGGHGLLLHLAGERPAVLTCYHVVAAIAAENKKARQPEEDLYIAYRQADGQWSSPIPVAYDPGRSDPAQDVVVLEVRGEVAPTLETPRLHEVDPETYANTLPVTGLTGQYPDSYEAKLSRRTPLRLKVQHPGPWPGAPKYFDIPLAHKLIEIDDVEPGISGSPVVCEGGVLGLTHFARNESPQKARQAYLIPLRVWARQWPALAARIEPFIDESLSNAADVIQVRELDAMLARGDERSVSYIPLVKYHADIYQTRPADEQAIAFLEKSEAHSGGLVVIGRPTSGKTRLAWELIRRRPDALLIIPKQKEPPETFEAAGLALREWILFYDDLHAGAQDKRPAQWWERLCKKTGRTGWLLCTARDGKEWENLENQGELLQKLRRMKAKEVYTSRVSKDVKLSKENADTGQRSNDDPFRGQDLLREEGRQLAQRLGLRLSDAEFEQRFDGTPGSLILNLKEMAGRYNKLKKELYLGNAAMNWLLDAAKLLHLAGQPRLKSSMLRMVTSKIIAPEYPISDQAWERIGERTHEEGFIAASDGEEVRIYRPYLEQCVGFQIRAKHLDDFYLLLLKEQDNEGVVSLAFSLQLFTSKINHHLLEKLLKTIAATGNANAYYNLGILLAEQQRLAEAEQMFHKAGELGYATAYNNRGILLEDQQRLEEAEQMYRMAGEMGNADAYHNLAILLFEQQCLEEAEQMYRKAGELGHAISYNSLGVLLTAQKRLEEAEQMFCKAIELDHTDAYYNLGILLEDQQRLEEAEQMYRKAIELGNASAYYNLSLLLIESDRKSEGCQMLHQAKALGVEEAEAAIQYFCNPE